MRNPYLYIRELVEEQVSDLAWDRGILKKRHIDPIKFADLYFGPTVAWRQLLIGEQGAVELRPGYDMEHPFAVYPVWSYQDDINVLEDLMANPLSTREEVYEQNLRPDEMPVQGQPHMIVINDIPSLTTNVARHFMLELSELNNEYPDVSLHIHNLESYNFTFGAGFESCDLNPRSSAAHGSVVLPAGRQLPWQHMHHYSQWVTILDMKPVDLRVPRNRCIYNIRSALWAGKYYAENYKFYVRSIGKSRLNLDEMSLPENKWVPPETKGFKTARYKPGDKQMCNTCSVMTSCKYMRDGAVCIVPGSENKELAKYFNTRDSEQIISGLGILMQAQSKRLERGMKDEVDIGELDPNVTKILNQLFDQGVKLAKLVNPDLRGGAKVQVNVGTNGAAAVSMGRPKQFIAAIIHDLEARGIERKDITPELVQATLEAMAAGQDQPKAIEGEVLARQDEKK